MKALITGITGFVGSHLAEHLLSCGDEVLGCSRGGKFAPSAPESLFKSVPVFRWNVADRLPGRLRQQFIEFAPDCIYHLAAVSVPKDCGESEPTSAAVATNIGGTRAVVELAAQMPSRPRLLLASSSYVYAPVQPDNPRVDEQAPLGPKNAYGKTKLAAEQQWRAVCDRHGLDGRIARAFQHTGPRQSPRMMLPEWCRQFARGDDPVRVISLDSRLDLTDVRDVVKAYRLLITRGPRGETYNVGSGIERRSGDVFQQLQQLAGPRGVMELSPGRQQQPIADITRITEITGWQPQIPLQQTIEDTWHYWVEETNR